MECSLMVRFFPPVVIRPLLLVVPFMPGFGIFVVIALYAISLVAFVLISGSHYHRHRHYRPK